MVTFAGLAGGATYVAIDGRFGQLEKSVAGDIEVLKEHINVMMRGCAGDIKVLKGEINVMRREFALEMKATRKDIEGVRTDIERLHPHMERVLYLLNDDHVRLAYLLFCRTPADRMNMTVLVSLGTLFTYKAKSSMSFQKDQRVLWCFHSLPVLLLASLERSYLLNL